MSKIENQLRSSRGYQESRGQCAVIAGTVFWSQKKQQCSVMLPATKKIGTDINSNCISVSHRKPSLKIKITKIIRFDSFLREETVCVGDGVSAGSGLAVLQLCGARPAGGLSRCSVLAYVRS